MNVAQLEAQVWNLLDDNGTYYPEPATLAALNEAQRFFCLLTLALETTASFSLAAAQPFYHVLAQLPDFLLPRRILNSNGQRLRPGRLSDLDAVNSTWQATPGLPQRYAHSGLDFLAVYPQSAASDVLTLVYAQAPPALVNQSDVPAIQENSHFCLANYAAYALRQAEGGQEMSKFTGYFNEFVDEAQRVQKLIKAKNLDARYEKAPFELEGMDRSRLLLG